MHAITYCSNVHPSKNLSDVVGHIAKSSSQIALACTPDQSFPLGLWLPEASLVDLDLAALELQKCLARHRMNLASFNGFPMGVFHGERVKENVYLPDWSTSERLHYTQNLARLGAMLGARDFSISSLSGGYKELDSPEKISAYHNNWLTWVAWAHAHHELTGSIARLALEPEPLNTLEDHHDAIKHWGELRRKAAERKLAPETLDRHLGLCFDTCHFSVRFIHPLQAWRKLEKAGIPVFKIQVSVALRLENGASLVERETFFGHQEPVYLHQTYHLCPTTGAISAFKDLPLAAPQANKAGEWRCHFHVPIHWGNSSATTGFELEEFLSEIKSAPSLPLLEIETYSFDALHRSSSSSTDLVSSIIQEWQWLKTRIARTSP